MTVSQADAFLKAPGAKVKVLLVNNQRVAPLVLKVLVENFSGTCRRQPPALLVFSCTLLVRLRLRRSPYAPRAVLRRRARHHELRHGRHECAQSGV